MALPEPESGLVISYSFLWKSESESGKDEGNKDRPCAVVLVTQEKNGDRIVTVVPITHSPPSDAELAVELPAQTRARLGFDDQPSWIIVTDLNRFVWPGPDLRLNKNGKWEYGFLPPKLFGQVKAKIIAASEAKRATAITRTS